MPGCLINALPFHLVRLSGAVGPELTVFAQRGVVAVSNESMEPMARLRTGPGSELVVDGQRRLRSGPLRRVDLGRRR